MTFAIWVSLSDFLFCYLSKTIMRYNLTMARRPPLKIYIMTNARDAVEKRGPANTADGSVTWYSHYEKMSHYDEIFG